MSGLCPRCHHVDGSVRRQAVEAFDVATGLVLAPSATRVGAVFDARGMSRIRGHARVGGGITGTVQVFQSVDGILFGFTSVFLSAPDAVSGFEVVGFEVILVARFVRVDYVNDLVAVPSLDLLYQALPVD